MAPQNLPARARFLFFWHVFDGLMHVLFESTFLYYSLSSSSPVPSQAKPTLWGVSEISYGARFSSHPLAKLWQEYALADKRWEEADVGLICLEVFTVFIAGPMALWVAYMVRKENHRAWFWMTVLATLELYGGWMAFALEWFSGSQNLVTDDWIYTWLYLGFFNALWVAIPLWILWQSYGELGASADLRARNFEGRKMQ